MLMDYDARVCLFFGDYFFIEAEEDMLGLPEEAQADIREVNAIFRQGEDVWMAYLIEQWPGWSLRYIDEAHLKTHNLTITPPVILDL